MFVFFNRSLKQCTDAIVEAYRPWCAEITDIMDRAWQNIDYANYIRNLTSFNPAQCGTVGGILILLQLV